MLWGIIGMVLMLVGHDDLYGQRSFAYGLGQAVQSGTTLGGCTLFYARVIGMADSDQPPKRGCLHIQSTQLYQINGLYHHQLHGSLGLDERWRLSVHIESLGMESASLLSGQGGLARMGPMVDLWLGPWAEQNPFKRHLPWSFGTDLWTRIKFSNKVNGHVYLSSEVWPRVSSGVDVWVEVVMFSQSTLSVGRSWMPLWGTRHSMVLNHQLFERVQLKTGIQSLVAYASERRLWTQFGGVSLSQHGLSIGFHGQHHPALGWSMGASLRWELRDDE